MKLSITSLICAVAFCVLPQAGAVQFWLCNRALGFQHNSRGCTCTSPDDNRTDPNFVSTNANSRAVCPARQCRVGNKSGRCLLSGFGSYSPPSFVSIWSVEFSSGRNVYTFGKVESDLVSECGASKNGSRCSCSECGGRAISFNCGDGVFGTCLQASSFA